MPDSSGKPGEGFMTGLGAVPDSHHDLMYLRKPICSLNPWIIKASARRHFGYNNFNNFKITPQGQIYFCRLQSGLKKWRPDGAMHLPDFLFYQSIASTKIY